MLTLIHSSVREEVKVILSEDFEFGKTSSDCVRRNKNNQFSLHTLAEACRRIHKRLSSLPQDVRTEFPLVLSPTTHALRTVTHILLFSTS